MMKDPRTQGAAVVTRGCSGLRRIVFLVAVLWVVVVAAAKTVHAGALDLALAIDSNPDPKIFETTIVARSAELDLTGEGKPSKVETYNGRIPGPEIRVKVGDQVVVTFKNKLSAPSSIHWHGIELNNASDGTAVSQDPVMPGESFVYRFQVTRPGIFWYHPHIKPTNQVFKGLYGSFIVTDDSDEKLTALGVLPTKTRTLVLSDTTICKAKGENDTETFPADDTLPWVGGPSFEGHDRPPTPRDLCEEPIDQEGEEIGKALPAGAVPNIQPAWNCRMFPGACRVNEGQIVLVNGRQPAGRAGSPDAPGPLAPGADPLMMKSGEALRLRVINAAASRYFRWLIDAPKVPTMTSPLLGFAVIPSGKEAPAGMTANFLAPLGLTMTWPSATAAVVYMGASSSIAASVERVLIMFFIPLSSRNSVTRDCLMLPHTSLRSPRGRVASIHPSAPTWRPDAEQFSVEFQRCQVPRM